MGGQGVSTSCRESKVYLLSIYYILLLYVCVCSRLRYSCLVGRATALWNMATSCKFYFDENFVEFLTFFNGFTM